jgi:hypothetical protein
MSNNNDPNIRLCLVKTVGSAGAAFLTISQCVDNLVKYLFGPGMFWLIAAPLLAGFWAFEYFCVQEGDDNGK